MLNYYASRYINLEVSARILFINNYGIYIKDENNLTGVVPITKQMKKEQNSIIYDNIEYKKDNYIKVKLIKDNSGELIYDIIRYKEKELVKRKEHL